MANGTSRIVYVFWNSNNTAQDTAQVYCKCVSNSPAVKAGCQVRCKLVDLAITPPDPATKFSSGNTIEVVAVRDDNKVDSVLNPSLGCAEVNDLVALLCS